MPAYPPYNPRDGYMSESVRNKFLDYAMRTNKMPSDRNITLRMPDVVTPIAPRDPNKPIQFWQLYSVLGERPVMRIVSDFYSKIYDNHSPEFKWFRDAFARISDKDHHIATQASMWLDCFGGGQMYHGGEYRLNFHHQHNAMQVMTEQGALLWIKLMEETLDEACGNHKNNNNNATLVKHFHGDMTQVFRVRRSLNTFLGYFMDDYAKKFRFKNYEKTYSASTGSAPTPKKSNENNHHQSQNQTEETNAPPPSQQQQQQQQQQQMRLLPFGERNPPIDIHGNAIDENPPQSSNTTQQQLPNLLNLSEEQIKSMKSSELKAALMIRHKVDVSDCLEREQLVAKALRL